MTPTIEQSAVYAAVRDDAANVVVESVAGSGKTSTAVGCALAATGKRVGFVAFNKHIATELQGRLAGRGEAKTLHSLGFAAIRRATPSVIVDEKKPCRLLESLRPEMCKTSAKGKKYWTETGRAILELSRLAKLTLCNETDPKAIAEMASHFGVDIPDLAEVAKGVADLIAESANRLDMIDFDDMVWLPVRRQLPVDRYDVLMVDESQDLSACQQALAARSVASGRMIPLGDRNQSLYGFSGADPEALPNLIQSLQQSALGAVLRPLTVTFRCPRSHVALAQRLVPEIQPADWAIDGAIVDLDADQLIRTLATGDLVICRRNAPLVDLAFRLIRNGIPARMLGRDIGKGLIDLIDKMAADTPVVLIGRVRDWQEKEIERLERKDAPASQVMAVNDRAECLIELAAEAESVSQLRTFIAGLFADQDSGANREKTITLASVHRAKGSEADRVFIIDPTCMPMVGRKSQPWEVVQENNILYVALTRAKKSLYFVGGRPRGFEKLNHHIVTGASV